MNLDSDQSVNITTNTFPYSILKHILLPILSIFIKILSKCLLKSYKIIYIESKIKYKYRKVKKPDIKPKMLLSIPCSLIFLMISFHTRESLYETDEIKNDTTYELFSPTYMSESVTTKNVNNHLTSYALSNLSFKKHSSFFKYLLLLSGDINLNPGPTVPCCICSKSLRQKIIFCNKCQSLFHKNQNIK